jgi:outer membrane immunogenic protein
MDARKVNMKYISYRTLATALFALSAVSGTAFGQNVITTSSGFNWSGFYAGLNAGGVWNKTCADWTSYVGGSRVANFLASCPNNNSFTYGLQAGYNFLVTPQFLIGGEADFGGWSTNNSNRTVTYTGTSPPPHGTYAFSGKGSPNGAGTIRIRFGYVVGDVGEWMPYVTGGYAYASGTPSDTITYTPTGATAPTATSNGVRTLGANGWTAGAGVEYGAATHFSVKLEWLYFQLGHGQQSGAFNSCTGADCSVFSGTGSVVSFQSHNSAKLNTVRLGANYLFNLP